MARRGAGWVLCAVVAVLALAGCSGEPSEPVAHIDMLDNFYGRDVTRVPVGAEVRFDNGGRAPHNAIALDGTWRTPETISAGEAATIVADRPGVYRFYCSFHANPEGEGMAATLVVGDVEYSASATELGRSLPVVRQASGATRRVPADHPTIQAAVDAAGPGDLVLVEPGTYREEVKVRVPSLVIRGTDRNRVVIDGELRRPNGLSITADGVAVENLTVRNTLANGVFWTGVEGYRASYVTAVNNGLYGVYAFDSVDGLFEHSYASGSPDSGFYIGQCNPCRAVITGVTAERNALGYSGTNAGGELQIVNSTWRDNWAGIVPNTLDSELLPPFREVSIAGNLVVGNGNRDAPGLRLQWGAFGNGIVLAGGNDSLVARNLVVDHPAHGILVTPNLDRNFWTSAGNEIRGNVIRGAGRAGIGLSAPSGGGNCFSGNDTGGTAPAGLQVLLPCEGLRLPAGMDLSGTLLNLGRVAEAQTGAFPDNDFTTMPAPPPQPQLPGGAGAPVRPAVDVYERHRVDLSTIAVPEPPPGLAATVSKEPTVSGVPLLASAWQMVFALYGYLLPFVLYAAWTSLALWDLARRDDLPRWATITWIVAILLVPFIGVLAYHVAGRPHLPAWLRTTMIAGGLAAYVVIAALAGTLGGIV